MWTPIKTGRQHFSGRRSRALHSPLVHRCCPPRIGDNAYACCHATHLARAFLPSQRQLCSDSGSFVTERSSKTRHSRKCIDCPFPAAVSFFFFNAEKTGRVICKLRVLLTRYTSRASCQYEIWRADGNALEWRAFCARVKRACRRNTRSTSLDENKGKETNRERECLSGSYYPITSACISTAVEGFNIAEAQSGPGNSPPKR